MLPAPVNAGLDRSDRDVLHLSDLFVGVAHDVVGQSDTKLHRNVPTEHPHDLRAVHERFWVARREWHVIRIEIIHGNGFELTAVAQIGILDDLITPSVQQNCACPVKDILAVKLITIGAHIDERLLHDVFAQFRKYVP